MRWLTDQIAFRSRNRNIKEPQVKTCFGEEASKPTNLRSTIRYFHLPLALMTLEGSHGVRKLSD